MDKKTVRSRKWLLTIQESAIKGGMDHDGIIHALENLKPDYYCMADEIGNETHQLHTHLMIYRSSPIRSSTIQKLFPGVHMDAMKGTIQEGRNYVRKEGKYAGTEKAETSVEGTFYEYGEPPKELGQGKRSDLENMMEMVKHNYSDLEIIEANPNLADRLTTIRNYRQLLIEEKAHDYRPMNVVYCWGKTGTGKTRGAYADCEDISQSYTVNDYSHSSGMFDAYDSAKCKVLILDEFRSSIPFNLLLSLTDGQYQVIMARYSNRIATHTKVWIISNIKLLEQYPNIQKEEPESWKAFLRRINTVRYYYDSYKYKDFTVEEYLQKEKEGYFDDWLSVNPSETPFGIPEEFTVKTVSQETLNLKEN